MAMKRSAALAMTGLDDPREMLQKDLMRMYSDYILSPGAQKNQPVKTAASLEPGWGDPVELEDEEEAEEISEDKGQIVELDAEEEEAQPVSEPEVTEEEVAAEEEIDPGLADVPAVSGKNTYEDELLALLNKAKANLETPKKLSIADILGAGTMRRSAELIRKTEQENEKRKQTAQELAIDILTRQSGSEEKRLAAESLADYRKRVLELRRLVAMRKPKDPVEERNKRDAMARFPNLSPEQAYQKFMELKYPGRTPPAPPKPALITRMAQIAIKRDNGTATPEELRELQMYEEQQKRNTTILDILMQRQPVQ
jgi:hypothetical protein